MITIGCACMLAGCPEFPTHLLQPDGGSPVDQNLQDRPVKLDDGAQQDKALLDASPDMAPPLDAPLDQAPDQTTPDLIPWPDLTPWPDLVPWPDTQGVLYQDDFSSGAAAWTDDQGTWVVQGGVYSQTACNQPGSASPDSMVTGQTWTDVTVSVRIRADQLCTGSALNQGGLAVRIQSITDCNNNYYFCVADFDDDFLAVGSLKGSCLGSGTSQSTPALQLNTWYQMELSAKGNQLTCRIWGGNLSSPVTVSRTDQLNPIPSGSAGMNLDGLRVSYDDFKVTAN
jgi:hypothetical protein